MGKQYNKCEKRVRRKRLVERRKAKVLQAIRKGK